MVQVVPVVLVEEADDLSTLAGQHPTTPLVVRIEPSILEKLADDLIEKLRGSAWVFAVCGFSRPILAMLPPSSQDLQITSEIEALSSRRLQAGPGLIEDGWDHTLPAVFARNGIRQVLVRWDGDPPTRPGITDHLGEAITVVPLLEYGEAEAPGLIHQLDPGGLVALITPPADLAHLLDLPTAQATTPDAYLSKNQISEPLHPPIDRAWRDRLDEHPQTALLYRRMMRMTGHNPARLSSPAARLLLSSQTGSAYRQNPLPAYQSLIRLRGEFENELRRETAATRLSKADWDGDTLPEVLMETSELSMAVDPADGTIPFFDYLVPAWPVGLVEGEGPLRLARTLRGQKHGFLGFSLLATEEARSGLGVDLIHPVLTVGIRVEGAQLTFTYQPSSPEEMRLGPEIPLRLDPTSVRMRVDGGQWVTVSEPSGTTGHRFRLEDQAHQVLIQLAQPGDVFLRPAADGILAWVNWAMGTGGEYRASISFAST